MRPIPAPSRPDAAYQELVQRMEMLERKKLSEVIPKAYFEPRLARSMIGFLSSYLLYGGSVAALALVPNWLFYLPLWMAAGLGGWGLHCIAHDCGHGSFSKSKRVNNWVGHLSLLPMVYPFHSWRHVHNLHHGATNSLEQDTDWRPIDPETFRRMPFLSRLNYASNRTVLFLFGTVAYWAISGFRPSFFPPRHMQQEVRRSILFVVLVCGAYIGALTYFTGLSGYFLYFVGPWAAIHIWFSITTLMHHTSEDVPFLVREHWRRTGSRLLLTTDYRYPRWLHFLTHNISIHTAHHVAPKMPSYNLPKATEVLKQAYPGMIREHDFSVAKLWRIVTRCHLYDPETGYYKSFFSRHETTASPLHEAFIAVTDKAN